VSSGDITYKAFELSFSIIITEFISSRYVLCVAIINDVPKALDILTYLSLCLIVVLVYVLERV